QGELFARLLSDNFLPAPAVMVRRNAIAAVGGYDESLFFEDFDMWLRLSRRFSFAYLPGQVIRLRMHPHSMSRNSRAMLASRAVLRGKWLDAGLDAVTRDILLDALLWTAALQLRSRDPAGARNTLRAVLAAEARPGRRRLARIAMLAGASAAVRLLLPVYR